MKYKILEKYIQLYLKNYILKKLKLVVTWLNFVGCIIWKFYLKIRLLNASLKLLRYHLSLNIIIF